MVQTTHSRQARNNAFHRLNQTPEMDLSGGAARMAGPLWLYSVRDAPVVRLAPLGKGARPMSSIPNITPGYHTDRPQIIGRIGQPATVNTAAADALANADKQDSVELSTEALNAAANTDTTRAQRLAQIKAQIQAGTYDEDSKLVFAADRIARKFANG